MDEETKIDGKPKTNVGCISVLGGCILFWLLFMVAFSGNVAGIIIIGVFYLGFSALMGYIGPKLKLSIPFLVNVPVLFISVASLIGSREKGNWYIWVGIIGGSIAVCFLGAFLGSVIKTRHIDNKLNHVIDDKENNNEKP